MIAELIQCRRRRALCEGIRSDVNISYLSHFLIAHLTKACITQSRIVGYVMPVSYQLFLEKVL